MQFLQPPPRHVRQVRCILSPQQGNGGTCTSGCTSAFLTWWRKPDGKYCLRICSGTDQTSPFRTGTEQIGLAPNDDTYSRGVRERKECIWKRIEALFAVTHACPWLHRFAEAPRAVELQRRAIVAPRHCH
ncbi:hypothetical protein FOYG_04270 [Fusarium oxysporum NRRL 32931]|uniref:Uncharacterized protein n=1 Tax=Fusarium oxysporum NRRL 32931 TaxID=660029 RepID=W9IRI7_FUSOX|nr:hypothetical protein FOYG_04270 [Fusarium oxysporum NRRL 32931]